MNRKWLLGLLMVIWGCDEPNKKNTIQINLTKAWWPAWESLQVGIKKRELDYSQFKTNFLQKNDYVPALNEFLNQNTDAATLTIYEAILAASKGIPLKIVLLLDYTIGSDGVVAKKDILKLPDLAGKKIGVEYGTIAHFTTLKAIGKAGLNVSDVKLIDADIKTLQNLFNQGELDAVGIYEPYMSQMINEGNGKIIFSSKEIPRSICDVLFVKKSFFETKPDVIEHWIESWKGVLNFKSERPNEFYQNLSQIGGSDAFEIEKSFDGIYIANMNENRRAFGTENFPGYLLESIIEMQEFMFENQVIPKKILIKELIGYGVNTNIFNK